MDVEILPVELSSSATTRLYAEVIADVTAADNPGVPPTTEPMVQARLRVPTPGHITELYIAVDSQGQAVGRAELAVAEGSAHRNAAIKLQISPEHRRRGHGTTLYSMLRTRAKVLGCETLTARTSWELPDLPAFDGGAGPAFAKAAGLEVANLPEVMRRLSLPLRNNGLTLGRIAASLRQAAHGYEITEWRETTPTAYAQGVAWLESRLAHDAPTGTLPTDESSFDTGWLLESEACLAARGQLSFQAGAIQRSSGQLVAHTKITADPSQPAHAWQQITIVDPDHRGHRLGFLVKAANIRAIQGALPSVIAIDTFNAAANDHMIKINDLLGMAPLHGFQHWYQRLTTE
ncbi:GNAT family N-acetyltransferase [Catelliglobosispora koreensis]|uniref:GNAT family N-acetyltransferase n=1 Tax=Catelliglobosispora koreensis TaxID=129052 RepID=UPI0003A5C7A0|nr:GNAT family N-acetyltransferase [Catelliglobosispora koreensis]